MLECANCHRLYKKYDYWNGPCCCRRCWHELNEEIKIAKMGENLFQKKLRAEGLEPWQIRAVEKVLKKVCIYCRDRPYVKDKLCECFYEPDPG